MLLYRIAKTPYAQDLTGTGGLFGPGRWHREGTRIVYLAERVSLAKLEVLANSRLTPRNQSLVTIEIADDVPVHHISADLLPTNWARTPYMQELADIAEQWIREQKFWVMRVPSVHSPNEYNYLLNPLHPAHQSLKIVSIEPHPFDSRLKG